MKTHHNFRRKRKCLRLVLLWEELPKKIYKELVRASWDKLSIMVLTQKARKLAALKLGK